MAGMKSLRVLAAAMALYGLWGCGPASSDAKNFLDDAEKKWFDWSLDASPPGSDRGTSPMTAKRFRRAPTNGRLRKAFGWRKAQCNWTRPNLPADQHRNTVLPTGGVMEKVLAARRLGIGRVILPKANEKDLRDLPEEVRKEMEFIFAARVEDVLSAILPGFASEPGKPAKAA